MDVRVDEPVQDGMRRAPDQAADERGAPVEVPPEEWREHRRDAATDPPGRGARRKADRPAHQDGVDRTMDRILVAESVIERLAVDRHLARAEGEDRDLRRGDALRDQPHAHVKGSEWHGAALRDRAQRCVAASRDDHLRSYFQLRLLPSASQSIVVARRFSRVTSVLASVTHSTYSLRWL